MSISALATGRGSGEYQREQYGGDKFFHDENVYSLCIRVRRPFGYECERKVRLTANR